MFTFKLATEEQVASVVEQLDEDSVTAIQLSGYEDYKQALRFLQQHSNYCIAILKDETPIAIFGAISIDLDTASTWLVAIKDLPTIPPRVVIQSRRFIQAFLKEFKTLRTVVWENNTAHIRWVEWLGFKDNGKVPYGIHGEPFHIYTLEN